MKTTITYITKYFFYLFVFLFTAWGCGSDDDPVVNNEYEIDAPVVKVSNPYPYVGEEVNFYYQTELSGEPSWEMGEGTVYTDAVINHTWKTEGEYDVELTFTDGQGGKAIVKIPVAVMGGHLLDELNNLTSDPSRIWICSHRGHTYEGKNRTHIPENSIPAILKCIETGIDMVEIDVRTTYDGVFVLMHDATINRTTNGVGAVANKTWEELKTYKLKANDGTVTEYGIPTLEEALIAGRGKIYFNLDVVSKGNNYTKMIQLIDSLYMIDRSVFYIGSDKDGGNEVLDAHERALPFPWVSSVTDINYWTATPRVGILQMGYSSATAETIISHAHAKNVPSFSNLLNDPDEAFMDGDYTEINKMLNMNLQVIQTDYGDKVIPWLKEKGRR